MSARHPLVFIFFNGKGLSPHATETAKVVLQAQRECKLVGPCFGGSRHTAIRRIEFTIGVVVFEHRFDGETAFGIHRKARPYANGEYVGFDALFVFADDLLVRRVAEAEIGDEEKRHIVAHREIVAGKGAEQQIGVSRLVLTGLGHGVQREVGAKPQREVVQHKIADSRRYVELLSSKSLIFDITHSDFGIGRRKTDRRAYHKIAAIQQLCERFQVQHCCEQREKNKFFHTLKGLVVCKKQPKRTYPGIQAEFSRHKHQHHPAFDESKVGTANRQNDE